MATNIIGMMWNRNEGDILEEIITEAIKHVDLLYIADDGSTDNSWEIIKDMEARTCVIIPQQYPDRRDPGQRQSLLDTIRLRHKPEDTWVQVIESDIMILDTDVREAIRTRAVGDVAVTWQTLNGVREVGGWDNGEDEYPRWTRSIKEVLPLAHRIENMTYTFRPLPDLYYQSGIWRPWPSGFSRYFKGVVDVDQRDSDAPLLAHYGFRGPTHFKKKYNHMGERHSRYRDWNITSRDAILTTVPYFNGAWNGKAFPMSRQGWANRKKKHGNNNVD